jgi:HSP20 family protein
MTAVEYAGVTYIFLDRRDLGSDLRRMLEQLDESAADAHAGECTPPCDVIERPDGIEIVMDIPGVPASAVTILFARNTVVIAGRKQPAACGHSEATFHMAERTFGRFARVVPIAGPCDPAGASATLTAGELRVTLPRVDDRRGREIRIPIRTS